MADEWNPQSETYVDYLIRTNGGNPQNQPTAPAASPAPPSLATDSTYLAFQRALGNEQDVATRNAQDQQDAIDRSTALRLPQIAQQGVYARQGITGRMEARGILRSGETEQNIGRERQSEADQTAGVYDQAAQQKAAIQQALAGQIAGFGSRTAEANLTAAGNQQSSSDAAAIQKALSEGMANINNAPPVDYSSLFGLPPAAAPPPPAPTPAARWPSRTNTVPYVTKRSGRAY